ncbi:uncharacterized protein LOC143200733 [Rhynchophorus ferrugineus]|uniref:uncharacterized protein LOC143200733 n=1 Tax=Rhynchophorus ferrugineus TaxID=354439 RepID=UPI003FCC4237
MKRIGKEPKLLPNVMEAIANLKERRGSTQKQIIEHLTHILKKSNNGIRNVTMQVRRALEHGLHSGLIKQKSGKYSLGLDKRDYAIFRRFRQVNEPIECGRRSRRGRGRRGRRGRRRRSRRRYGRKRNLSAENGASDDSDSSHSINEDDNSEPMDKGRRRRRRRRGRKGRRRGRRGRRHATDHEVSSDSSVSAQNETSGTVPAEKRKSDQEKIDHNTKNGNAANHNGNNHSQENHQSLEEDDVECGNPDCLCNIKQEDDSPRCMSREDYYRDSYLN